MYTGSCLCNTVRFEIHGGIRNIVFCHCSQCRKAQGSAFATNGIVNDREFHIIQGEDQLTGYEASENQTKFFCKHCGSPIYSKNTSYPDQVRVRLGTIETNIIERPEAHIFATSKANWETIEGDLPQFEEYEKNKR